MSTTRADPPGGPAHAEHLTTGWEPDVPVGDTLQRTYLFHWADYCEAYALAGGGRSWWTGAFHAADPGHPTSYFASATLLAPLAGPHVLDAIEDFYRAETGEVMLWSAWPLPSAALAARGWQLVGHPPLMVRAPHAPAPAARTLDVRRVDDTAGLADWERVAVEGYPLPEVAGQPVGSLAHPSLLGDQRCAFWVGYDQGRAVSLGTSFTARGITSFAFGVTLPHARRRGHWTAHARARIQAHPDRWLAGVFSDDARPGAERIGFLPVQRLSLYCRPGV